MIPQKQKDISSLDALSPLRYENLFTVNQAETDNKKFYYYNISNKLMLPENIDSQALDSVVFDRPLPWTIASYKIYGSIYLWYILFMLNSKKIKSKFLIPAGESVVFIKPQFVNDIISKINE